MTSKDSLTLSLTFSFFFSTTFSIFLFTTFTFEHNLLSTDRATQTIIIDIAVVHSFPGQQLSSDPVLVSVANQHVQPFAHFCVLFARDNEAQVVVAETQRPLTRFSLSLLVLRCLPRLSERSPSSVGKSKSLRVTSKR